MCDVMPLSTQEDRKTWTGVLQHWLGFCSYLASSVSHCVSLYTPLLLLSIFLLCGMEDENGTITGRGETLHNHVGFLIKHSCPPPTHIFTSEHVLLLQGLSPPDYCRGCTREHLLTLCHSLFLGIASKGWLQNPSRLWMSKRRISPHLDPSSETLCGVQHYRPTSSPYDKSPLSATKEMRCPHCCSA